MFSWDFVKHFTATTFIWRIFATASMFSHNISERVSKPKARSYGTFVSDSKFLPKMNFSTEIHFEFLLGFKYISFVFLNQKIKYVPGYCSLIFIELRDLFTGALWNNCSEIFEISPEKY